MDWKGMVRSVAPAIATAFGGPLAGLGVKAVSEAVLGKPDGTEEEIEKALINATPDMLFKLKEADQAFRLEMKRLDVDLERLRYDDIASARKRQAEVKDATPAILAYILTFGFFALVTALFLKAIPEANKATIYTMVGSLGTVWIAAMAYFHGTTRSSARKDAVIAAGTKST